MCHALAVAVSLLSVSAAAAQTGTLDQVSPTPSGTNSAGFNASASFLVWQSQIRCGVAGQLEGARITLTGPTGAQVAVRIRTGPAWSAGAALFDGLVTKATPDLEVVFVNTAASNINLAVGDLYVMEVQGNDTQCGLNGSYIAPPGTPLYPEPLFLMGMNFADGGWRHGFETFMIESSVCYPDCNQDGVLTVADFGCFQTSFVSGQPYADCNGDGVRTVADFGCFQTKFVSGCP